MTSPKISPSSVPGVDPTLVKMLGRKRALRLVRFSEHTGLSTERLLVYAFDLLECAIDRIHPRNREAVTMGAARWRGVAAEDRAEIARRAVSARWAKHRDKSSNQPT